MYYNVNRIIIRITKIHIKYVYVNSINKIFVKIFYVLKKHNGYIMCTNWDKL